jgi:Capsule polysaccharide biosynthesis protein
MIRSDSEAPDRRAWEAICNWHQAIDLPMVREGLDHRHLTRCFLWDKVSRAIRQQVDPAGFQLEAALLAQSQSRLERSRPNASEWLKRPVRPLYTLRDRVRLRLHCRDRPILFAPHRHLRLKASLLSLSRLSDLVVVVPHDRSPDYAVGHPTRLPRAAQQAADVDYAAALHQSVIEGLRSLQINLLPQDQQRLGTQILDQLLLIRRVEAELNFVRPQALLMFADNHHPMQAYVQVAKRMGIPTVLLQHGLDCEHYCLDEAYASAIAVWGEARRKRYQHQSVYQPDHLWVTGNPEFDHLRLPEALDLSGNYWLWVTRPHRPEKCFSPSRSPQEGLDILAALAKALKRSPTARLLIKPHPADYADRYQAFIAEQGLGDRIEIVQSNVQLLLAGASCVISEDSTAGLEALFFGKVVVHAHFAASKPTLPFVQFGAALPGYSAELLEDSLKRAAQLTSIEQDTLLKAQRQFIQDYAGNCDGQAHQRVFSRIAALTLGKEIRD